MMINDSNIGMHNAIYKAIYKAYQPLPPRVAAKVHAISLRSFLMDFKKFCFLDAQCQRKEGGKMKLRLKFD